jgi:hypothetical protein
MEPASAPTSLDVLQTEGDRRAAAKPGRSFDPSDFDDHIQTYKGFVRGIFLFVAHMAVILIGLAFFLL